MKLNTINGEYFQTSKLNSMLIMCITGFKDFELILFCVIDKKTTSKYVTLGWDMPKCHQNHLLIVICEEMT